MEGRVWQKGELVWAVGPNLALQMLFSDLSTLAHGLSAQVIIHCEEWGLMWSDKDEKPKVHLLQTFP